LYDHLIDAAKTIRWKGASASELNDVIQYLLLSRWYRNRKVRLLLDLPDLSNDASPLIEQGDDLLIGVVYLLSAGRKSSVGF
jgi:hypothetical protein